MSHGAKDLHRKVSTYLAQSDMAEYPKGYGKRTALAAAIAMSLAPNLTLALDIVSPDFYIGDQNYDIRNGVTVSGDNGWNAAIHIVGDEGGAYNSTLTNAGHIEHNGTGNALVMWAPLAGDFINSGSISIDIEDVADSVSAIVLSEGVRSAGTLLNSGSIAVSVLSPDRYFSTATGIYVDGLHGELMNSATGHISAQSQAAQTQSIGVYLDGFSDGTFINAGTITAEVSDYQDGWAMGVLINTFSGTLENLGTISGTGGQWSYSIYGNYLSGTIINRASGVLEGSLFLFGSDLVVENAGRINLPDIEGGYIGGNYLQTATGTLSIGAYGTDDNEYSRLYVGGDVTLAAGTTAAVNVREGNTGETRLVVGEKLLSVLSADGTLTGNFSRVTDNSALFNFRSLAYEGEGGHIDFEILKGLTATESAITANNPMALGAASVFDSIITGSASGDMQDVVDALGSLETEQAVSNALSQTLPLLSSNLNQAAGNALRGTSRVLRERLGSLQGRSSGEGFYGDEQLWLKAFGSWADQDDRQGVSGYDAETSGLVLGSDALLSPADRLGVAFAYARSDVNSNSQVARQSAKVDSFQALLYGSHSLSDATALDFQLDVGRHNNDGQRDINFGGLNRQAQADYSSWSAHLGAALSHSLQWTEQTRFIPALRADYSWIRAEDYEEKGADALNLEVGSNRTEALILGVDGQLDHELTERLSLSAKAGLGYDLINDQASTTSAFAGAPVTSFTTRGLDPSPWVKTAGLGLSYSANEQTRISAAYDVEGREDFINQTASVKVRWAF